MIVSLRFDPDAAAMIFDRLFAERQTDPGSRMLIGRMHSEVALPRPGVWLKFYVPILKISMIGVEIQNEHKE